MSEHPKDRILGHADEADGIDEYDNDLPAWWVGLFVVSIAFAVVYTVDYHFVSGRSEAAEYEAEVAAAELRWPKPTVTAVVEVTPELIAKGREVYTANCAGCHGAELKGAVGPNLTDAEWIHGGTLPDITKTITDGVPEKGMLTWGPILGPEKISQVAAYVYSSGGGR
ncbi:MAG: c-type cytochrome [Myxococcota bacterium]